MNNVIQENYKRPLHWQIIDTLIYEDGHEEVREYYNLVVDDCSKLIACLMSNQPTCKGIKYWAVGRGESNWSNENSPIPELTNSSLVNETFRKEILPENITFIDNDNNPTESFTSKLQITVEFTESEANGELREFALFGGTATEALNSGIMINHKIHPLICKTSGMKLKRVIRLAF